MLFTVKFNFYFFSSTRQRTVSRTQSGIYQVLFQRYHSVNLLLQKDGYGKLILGIFLPVCLSCRVPCKILFFNGCFIFNEHSNFKCQEIEGCKVIVGINAYPIKNTPLPFNSILFRQTIPFKYSVRLVRLAWYWYHWIALISTRTAICSENYICSWFLKVQSFKPLININ